MSDELPDGAKVAIKEYLTAHQRSVGAAFLFAVVLGPVGALYGSVIVGSVLTLCTVAALLLSGLYTAVAMAHPVAPMLVGLFWLMAIVFAPLGAYEHNRRVTTDVALRMWHGCMGSNVPR